MTSTNTLGKYQIIREIARSNDIVYEAVDPTLGRRVALKELYLAPNLTGAQKRERIERFLREGKAAGQLAHPNIVTIYDVGQDGDRLYIAMEFLEGQTLRDVIKMRGALPVKETVDIALQLCDALSYAHAHNIVHRDVKPENVQILPGGHVKLTDFGIARIMSEPSITADGQVFGTPSYMSPEQVSGKQIDGRSDVFSLGVLLYEMLSGQKPFAGDTVVTITYNIMNSEPPPPPGVPPYLVAISMRAMAKDPGMRYQSIEALEQDLQNEPSNGAAAYGDPFGTATQPGYPDPFGSGGYTPSPAPPQTVPDPFAKAPGPLPQPMPREPLLSPETRTFLGVLLIVLGLAGMLVFAVWAINGAYEAYVERTAVETSHRYIVQGDRLLADGKMPAAIDQYSNAARAGGETKAGREAKKKLAIAYAELARQAYVNADYQGCADQAMRAVQWDESVSAGHYYLGSSGYYLGDLARAEYELKKTIDAGGNDEFAIAARKHLSKIYVTQGDALAQSGSRDAALTKYNAALDLQDPDWTKTAQDRITEMNGQGP